MEQKPTLLQIFEHANTDTPWIFGSFWLYFQYTKFCEGKVHQPDKFDLSEEIKLLEHNNKFIDWLLEKYWPDWRNSENG